MDDISGIQIRLLQMKAIVSQIKNTRLGGFTGRLEHCQKEKISEPEDTAVRTI